MNENLLIKKLLFSKSLEFSDVRVRGMVQITRLVHEKKKRCYCLIKMQEEICETFKTFAEFFDVFFAKTIALTQNQCNNKLMYFLK